MSKIVLLVAVVLVAVVVTLLLRWQRGNRTPPSSKLLPDQSGPPPNALPAPAATAATQAATPAGLESLFAQLHALALEDPRAAEVDARPDAAHMPVLLAASAAIAQIGTEPRYTPRRPSMLPQLLESMSDENASLRALSRTIAQDPELTSQLLRTANSVHYRVSSAPVESIERASALVGTTGLRTLITAALMRPLSAQGDATGTFGEVMWEHSLYSASGAEAFAARGQDCDPYTAHLLGLLHGLGSVAVYRTLLDQYAAHSHLAPDAAAISQALETQAAVTAKRIADNWGLSGKTQEALESQSSAAPSGEHGSLGRALRFGRAAGAVALLCRRGTMTAEEGRARLAAGGHAGAQIDRIWERMVKAYVEH